MLCYHITWGFQEERQATLNTTALPNIFPAFYHVQPCSQGLDRLLVRGKTVQWVVREVRPEKVRWRWWLGEERAKIFLCWEALE